MKKVNEVNNISKGISMFTKRLQNCSTRKKLNNKDMKDNNNKMSVTIFNNTTITPSKSNWYKPKKYLNRSSSFINSKQSNDKIFSPNKLYAKKSAVNLNKQNNIKSPILKKRNKDIKTSIMNNQTAQNPSLNKTKKNIFYSPSSPYTPTISSLSDFTSRQSDSNKSTASKAFPTAFNPFLIPAKKIEVNKTRKSQIDCMEKQEIFKQKINLLLDSIFQEISKLSKKLAGIDYNKRMKLIEANELYIKQMKELYEKKEKKIIHVYDKYKYDLDNLKYRERKKYLEMFKNKAEELLLIENNFNFQKEQIKTTYQMDYDLIKQREDNEIQKLLEKKIIEKTRNKLLNILDNN